MRKLIFALCGSMVISSLPAKSASYEAICSYYSDYQPCKIEITPDYVEGNLPTGLLFLDKNNFYDLNVYEDLGTSSNVLVGTISTLILGPAGLLGFLVRKKTGTIDYAFKFIQSGRKRTALVRFVNMKSASRFAKDASTFAQTVRTVSQ